MRPKNFQEFQATRRRVYSVAGAFPTGGDDVLEHPGYLYCGDQLYIYHDSRRGVFWTCIENMEPSGTLTQVEEVLYKWAISAGFIDCETPKCGQCGHDMRPNVPRLGADGGYVHADTGSPQCADADDAARFRFLLEHCNKFVIEENVAGNPERYDIDANRNAVDQYRFQASLTTTWNNAK